MTHHDDEYLIPSLQLIPLAATWTMLQLSSTQLSPDKSHSGSRSQQKAVRERIEWASVERGSAD